MDVKPGISRHKQRRTSLGNTPGWVEEEEAAGETGARGRAGFHQWHVGVSWRPELAVRGMRKRPGGSQQEEG